MKSIVIIDTMSDQINWDRIRENYRDYARIRNNEHRTRVRRRRLMQATEEPSQSPTMNESGAPLIIGTRQGDADDDAAVGLDDDLFGVTDDVPGDDVPTTDDDEIGVDDDVSVDEEPSQAPNAVGVDDDLPVDLEPSQAPTSDNGTVTDDDAVGVDDDLPAEMEPSQAPDANMTDDDAVGVDDDLPPEMEPSIAPSESLGSTEDDDAVGIDDDFPSDAEPSFAPSESAAPSESSVPSLSAIPSAVSMEDDDAIGVDDDLPPDMIRSDTPSEAPSDLEPTSQPTDEPTLEGTDEPTSSPTQEPTRATPSPSREPTLPPTREATPIPTPELTSVPTPVNGGVVFIPVYEYSRGNCPNEGSTGLPCAPTNIGRVCSKYDDSGSFSECLRICEPSFCCVHDSPADTNSVASSCARDENCAQYAPCYIVWWKIVDTVGPAAYLRLQQNDDFFDVDKLQDVTSDRDFYAQWAYHHWDDIDELLYDLLDPAESLESVFANPNIWNPTGT
jgi:hypothetical protein